MQELFQHFIDVDNIFWGDDIFRWWFYIAILVILIFEKRRTTKIILAWFSVAYLIGLFNPISISIMSLISSAWQYRARLYSMFPIPYVLALGSIIVFDKMRSVHSKDLSENGVENRKWPSVAKLVLVGFLCVCIVLGGTDVYKQEWMQPANNLEKVPIAILELKEKMDNQKDICIAVPESLSSYIRQVAPEFYTPYGRYVDSLGRELSQINPEPMSVMTKAGEESCDYIVVYDNEENKTNFRNSGYEAYDQLSGYIIYKVEKVPFIQKTYNEKRQVTSIMFLDKDGIPIVNDQGYSGIAFEYDWQGRKKKEAYLDSANCVKTLFQGYAVVERDYSQFSRQIVSEKYYDNKGELVLVNGRFETRYTYDNNRRLKTESYYDDNGSPMNRTDLSYALKQIEYDHYGNIIAESYYDPIGDLVVSALGYATYKKELTEDGKIWAEVYYDEKNNRIGNVIFGETNHADNIFRFLRCTHGVIIQEDAEYTLVTGIQNNRFNMVHFQLYDANSNAYLTTFGNGSVNGIISGQFVSEYPSGIYRLSLKGNSNLADESISCLIYIENGSILDYSYTISELSEKKIGLRDVSVKILN